MATVNCYFDGSDVSATDPDNVWTNETNAQDGSITTYANTISGGGEDENYVQIEGTNAVDDGTNIDSVRARIYTDAGWDIYHSLSTPSGGWTWAKLQSLETRFWFYSYDPYYIGYAIYEDGNSGSTSLLYTSEDGQDSYYVYKIELEVTTSVGSSSISPSISPSPSSSVSPSISSSVSSSSSSSPSSSISASPSPSKSYYDIPEEDYLAHDTVYAKYSSIAKLDDTHAILAYRASDDDGHIKIFSLIILLILQK